MHIVSLAEYSGNTDKLFTVNNHSKNGTFIKLPPGSVECKK